jgi:DNA mismatch repair protein MutL
MKGRYPVCCLFLELPPDEVDVNIHPAKREVKFHREMAIRRFVAEGVRQALHRFAQPAAAVTASSGSVPIAAPTQPVTPQPPVPAQHQPALPSFPAALVPVPEPVKVPVNQPAFPMGFAVPAVEATPGGTPSTEPERATESTPKPDLPGAGPVAESVSADLKPASAVAAPGAPIPLLNVPLRMVGVIGRLYVLFESDRGLVLLDQHAAHERILFEQMLQRLETQTQADSQKLLLPETVELSARDAQFLREQLAVLTRLGVGLSEFGDRTFLLDALPPFVKCGNPRKYVLELVDELKAAGQQVNTLRLGEHVVAKTVCRHAVKANDPLGTAELENLVEDLRTCAMPYTCPHGRPTIIEMNFRELEKKFGRAQ